MPTYLCHGFRWSRDSIRIYIAIHDLGDGAVEWIVAPRSARALQCCFHDLYDFLPWPSTTDNTDSPSRSSRSSSVTTKKQSTYHHDNKEDPQHDGHGQEGGGDVEEDNEADDDDDDDDHSIYHDIATDEFPVKLLEEYDPEDLKTLNAPWAYVADRVIPVSTSVNIAEEMARYDKEIADSSGDNSNDGEGTAAEQGDRHHNWIGKLRDQIQKGAEIQWFVVVCGDEERRVSDEEEGEEESVGELAAPPPRLVEPEPEPRETLRQPKSSGHGEETTAQNMWDQQQQQTTESSTRQPVGRPKTAQGDGGGSDGDSSAAATASMSNDGNPPKSPNVVRRLMSKLHVGKPPP